MRSSYPAAVGIAAALTLALPVGSFADSPTPVLSTAKTIQVHETIRRADKSGTLVPAYEIDLRIARPSGVKAVITAAGLKTPSQYVDSGTEEKEYNAKSNTFRTLSKPTKGPSSSMLREMAQVDLILASGQLPAPKKNVQRAVTTETVNGVAMTVTTDTLPPMNSRLTGETVVTVNTWWVETATGQPYRSTTTSTSGGKTTLTEEETFTSWNFDQSLEKSQMAFAPPADAKPYVAPSFAMTSLAVGVVAPDFSAVTPDGKTVRLSDFKGKVVILDFWATWCHPCQDAMPHLESVYKQVKNQNVAVLGLCVWDNKVSYDKWVAEKVGTYTFPTAFDPAANDNARSIAGKLYNMNAIPTQYVIAPDGKIAAVFIGDEGQQLEKALAAQGIAVSINAASTVSAAK